MIKIPKLKLYASTNADFRMFQPVTLDVLQPVDLTAYQWQAHVRDGETVGAAKKMEFTCQPTATGFWFNAAKAALTALLVGAEVKELTFYGNLLYQQPDLAGVQIPAAEIELVVNAGDTVWVP